MYQGDNGSFPIGPTNRWPVYFGPSTARQYWLRGNITSDQPVLELVPGPGSGGAMFWSETYSGGSISITIHATASIVFWGGTPFQVYLFLKPTLWGIGPEYNYINQRLGRGGLHVPQVTHRVLRVMLSIPRAQHRTSWFSGTRPCSKV
jgi:hypothetical protein